MTSIGIVLDLRFDVVACIVSHSVEWNNILDGWKNFVNFAPRNSFLVQKFL